MQNDKEFGRGYTFAEGIWGGRSGSRSGSLSEEEVMREEKKIKNMKFQEEVKDFFNRLETYKEVSFQEIRKFVEKVKEELPPTIFGEGVLKAFLENINKVLEENKDVSIVWTNQELIKYAIEGLGNFVELKRVREDIDLYQNLLRHPLYPFYQDKKEWRSKELVEVYNRLKSFITKEDIEGLLQEAVGKLNVGLSMSEVERIKEELRLWIEDYIRSYIDTLNITQSVLETQESGLKEGLKEELLEELKQEIKRELKGEIKEELLLEAEEGFGRFESETSLTELQERLERLEELLKEKGFEGGGEDLSTELFDLRADLEALMERVRLLEEKQELLEKHSKSQSEKQSFIQEGATFNTQESIKREDLFSTSEEEKEERILSEVSTATEEGKKKKKDQTKYMLYAIVGGIILLLLLVLLK